MENISLLVPFAAKRGCSSVAIIARLRIIQSVFLLLLNANPLVIGLAHNVSII